MVIDLAEMIVQMAHEMKKEILNRHFMTENVDGIFQLHFGSV